MTLILDAGALIALDRGDRTIAGTLSRLAERGEVPRTHGGVVGQVWRDGRRQALLARWLSATEVVAVDEELGRRAGELLAITGANDVIDAALIALCRPGDEVATSDLGDLLTLAQAANVDLDIFFV